MRTYAYALLLLMFSVGSYASDPSTSIYLPKQQQQQQSQQLFESLELPPITTESTETPEITQTPVAKETAEIEKCLEALKKSSPGEEISAREAAAADRDPGWHFFNFTTCYNKPVSGSVSLELGGDAQAVKINPLNYYLWMGGNIKIPFQLILAGDVAENADSTADTEAANSETLLNTETGAAVRVPLYWIYNGSRSANPRFGLCNFGQRSIGRCTLGGDITINTKNLDKLGGGKEAAYGGAIRVGASIIFPVLDQNGSTNNEAGYLAIAGRLVAARANLDDPSQLFTPVTDASGNPIAFKEGVTAAEVELKLTIKGKIAIGAKWFTPLDNKDYLESGFKLSLDNKF